MNSQPYLIYYLMAKEFHFTPEQVDNMDKKTMEAMLYISGEHSKHEEFMMKSRMRK